MTRPSMRNIACLLLAFCLFLSSCTAPMEKATLALHVLEVGNADCFLFVQGESAMLIDGGEPDDADRIVTYLHTHGVKQLDAMIMTHPHADHIGGLERVVAAFHPKTVYYADIPDGIEPLTPMHTRLFKAIDRSKATLYEAGGGATFALGLAQVEIYPLEVTSDDANDYSLITRVTFGEERFLFMGDALEAAQTALLDSGRDITATVLKMSHHGGKVSTTRRLLKAVNPKAAILTCGAENHYNHPHADTLAALEERGVVSYRSDVYGHMILRFDGCGERFIETAR